MKLFGFRKKKPSLPPLRLANTLTRTKEDFSSLQPSKATLYSCGPTVYDYAHIGNLRAYVFSDMLKRTLIENGYRVNHTINITDFGHLSGDGDDGEDKMMVALKREGKPRTMEAMKEIADRFTDAFKEDVRALNILPPTQYTRASEYMREEVALVKMLDEKGYAYKTSDGLYFDISRFPTYGKLGNINLAALKEGARVEANPEKKHPADFAIWKFGELGWDSPWGKGFPGWHIECTAMAFATLGKQIDIHTGGIDHISTHHNGEIAQAEAATSKVPYVRYWMHSAFITLESKRIGKSVGNAITLRQVMDRGYNPLVYRYWLLTGHYNSPMNFTFEALDGAKQAHFKLKRHIFEELAGATKGVASNAYYVRLMEKLNDDLDTPGAIALLWEVVKDKDLAPGDRRATIKQFDEVLALGLFKEGVDGAQPVGFIKVELLPVKVKKLVAERESARKEKRWEDADGLRQAINMEGYVVEDSPQGMRVTKSQ